MSELHSYEEMSSFFDLRSGGYDEHMRGLFEHFEGFYTAVTSVIEPTDRQVRILDLGCGTGAELSYLFSKAPNAQITGIDLSPLMLEKLKVKYADRLNQITLVCGSYLDIPFDGDYDYVLSVYTMHHLLPETKHGLYGKIREALKPGGVYVEGDYVVEEAFSRELLERYAKVPERFPAGAQYHIDIPLSVNMQADLLQQAGFESPQVWQLEKEAAVFAAVKAVQEEKREEREFLAWVTQQWHTPFVTGVAESAETHPEKVRRLTLIDGTRRYLKRMESIDGIRSEANLHDAMLTFGVRTAAPLPTRSGERWAERGGHLFVLTEELAGVVINEVQPREALLFGHELAKLHQAMAVLEDRVKVPGMNLAQQLEEWAIPRVLEAAEKNGERDAIEKLAAEMTSGWFPLLEQIPKQLIHRDAHPGNMVMAEDGTVGFLDFEISVSGLRLFDICYFCTSQWIREYTTHKFADPWLNLVTAFRQGYEEISPLSRLERTSAFCVMCAIQMIFISYFHGADRPDLAGTNLEALLGLIRNRRGIELVFE